MKNIRMKKVMAGILCAVTVAGALPIVASADSSDVSVVVNGKILYFDGTEPRIIGNGTTMVPFRAIFEALGFYVDYSKGDDYFRIWAVDDDKDLRADLYVGEKTIYASKNSEYANAKSKSLLDVAKQYEMPEAPFIDGAGYTLVPARAIAELSGAQVRWEGEQKTVYIEYDNGRYDGDNKGGKYNDTEIPTYNEITGVASKAVDDGESDEYLTRVKAVIYAYDYSKENYDKYVKAIEEAGCVKIAELEDNGTTEIYESKKNEYLYIWKSSEDTLAIMPVSKMDIYLSCQAPNYTYYTGRKCFQWEMEGAYSVYYYIKEEAEVNEYEQALKSLGYTETSRKENKSSETVSIKYANIKTGITLSIVTSENFICIMPINNNK